MFYGEIVAICIKGKSLFWAHSSFPPFHLRTGALKRIVCNGEVVRDVFSLVREDLYAKVLRYLLGP